MTVTVRDSASDFEINIGPSEAVRGAFNVTVFARERKHVERGLAAVADMFTDVRFTDPAHCADGRWGAMGRVRGVRADVLPQNPTASPKH